MKRHFLLAFLALSSLVFSQDLTATLADGRSVLLSPNGTWRFLDAPGSEAASQPPSAKAPSLVVIEPRIKTVTFSYDPAAWTCQKLSDGTAEYQLISMEGDAYARIITEKARYTKELMRAAILGNAQRSASSFAILEEKEVDLHGIPASYLRADIGFQGQKFTFFWYYFSSDKGTVQLFAYTTKDLFEERQDRLEELLAGIAYK